MISLSRVGAIALRIFYLYRGSPARLAPMLIWVVVDVLLWGLLTWGLGLALSEAYYRIRPTGLEDDLDRER